MRFITDQDTSYEKPGTYRVFVEDEFRFAFDPDAFTSLGDVLDIILSDHIAPLRADGLKDFDLAIWRDCRILAVIRVGPDGDPNVTLI